MPAARGVYRSLRSLGSHDALDAAANAIEPDVNALDEPCLGRADDLAARRPR